MPSPEHYTAGSGARGPAYLLDLTIAGFVFMVLNAVLEGAGNAIDNYFWFGLTVFVYQSYFLSQRHGVTPGKSLRDVCVIGASGNPLTVGQSLARAALTALPWVSVAAGDLHVDVVNRGLVTLIPSLGLGYLCADVALLENARDRRTVTDRLTRTLVVNLPPLQPHRAPAAPMFSAHDAEFGHPPRQPGAGRPSEPR